MAIERIEIILEGKDGATPTVKSFNRSLGETEKQAKGTKGALDEMGGALKGAIAAVSVTMVAQTVSELVSLGIESGRARVALETMAGGVEEADAALVGMVAASGGALDNLSAMQNATRMFSMGLASTADEAAQLTEIAITLGATMGKGPKDAIEEFTLMLANQSILRLDTFGISGAKVRDIMNEMAQEMPGASRETRFLAAVMEEAGGKMDALEASGFKAVSSVDRLGATFSNAKQSAGTFLAEGLMPILDGIMAGNDAMKEHELEVRSTAGSYEEYRLEIERANEQSNFYIAKVDILSQSQYNQGIQAEAAADRMEVYAYRMQDVEDAAGEAAASLDSMVVSGKKLTAQSLGSQALKQLDSALKEGFITQGDYDKGAREIMTTFMGMDASMINANFALAEVTKSFAEGESDSGTFLDNLTEIGLSIGELPKGASIGIDFDLDLEGLERAKVELGRFSGRIVVETPTIEVGQQQGFATGGSFFVSGPAGVDNVPVGFMATAGEKVTVSNGGDEDNSRSTSILQGGVVNINNTQNQKQFEKMLERIGGV